MNRTLVIIKPGCPGGVQAVHDAQHSVGLRFESVYVQLTPEAVDALYAEHVGKPFYQAHRDYMTSGQLLVGVMTAYNDDAVPNVVQTWRNLMGPTDPRQGSGLRNQCCGDNHLPHNGFHGSDSPEAAEREIAALCRTMPEIFSKLPWMGRVTHRGQRPAIMRPSVPMVRFAKLDEDATIPTQATPGSAGFDLYAVESVNLVPGVVCKVSTGLAVAVPEGYEMQVRARSGMAYKGVIVANGPGTVDSDYRGELCVLLLNTGSQGYNILAGDRIAQAVFAPVQPVDISEVAALEPVPTRSGGFGSTGR